LFYLLYVTYGFFRELGEMALETGQGRWRRRGNQASESQTDSLEIQWRRRSFHMLLPFPRIRWFTAVFRRVFQVSDDFE